METIAIPNVVPSDTLQVYISLNRKTSYLEKSIDSFHNALYRTEAGHGHQVANMQIRTATMVIYMTEVDEVCYTDTDLKSHTCPGPPVRTFFMILARNCFWVHKRGCRLSNRSSVLRCRRNSWIDTWNVICNCAGSNWYCYPMGDRRRSRQVCCQGYLPNMWPHIKLGILRFGEW